ncbi:hyphal tip protein [Gymnopilus junonius]|uniref:Hyphal tip protein n=1 Tax=Gymnopilus junonius TaxID=109634 RepID=A0A9P5NQX1_GYMJU|nr:hyphal tip protein [Gymnopilus junonius]
MWLFFELLLGVLHFIYAGALAAKLFWKRHSRPIPQPLTAFRRRIPKHLSIIFAVHPTLSEEVTQEVLTESVVDAVAWCRTIGIKKLTVYEERDLLSKCVQGIRERLSVHSQEGYSSESETEYPITPPPSDYSESRPLSPDHSQGNVLPITIIRVGDSIAHESSKSKQKLQRRQRRSKSTFHMAMLLPDL